MYKLLSVFSICSMLWVSATAVHAQSSDATKAARRAYAQGQELFRRGDYVAAERAFREAYEAVPNPVVLLGIAEAQQRQALWEEAAGTLESYLEQRPDAPDREQVMQQLEEIRARPGVLHIESTPPGALILIDGQDSGEITPADIEVSAGDHMVVVRGLDGYELQADVQVPIGGEKSLSADLTQVEPEPEPVAAAEPEPADPYVHEELAERRVRRAAWTTLGVATTGVIMGSVLGGLALKAQKDYDENPTVETADRGERLAIFADVGFGIAIAAAVTSVVLFVSRGSGEERAEAVEPRRFALVPAVGRDGGGVGALVKF